ncbi:MAG: serine hydroxymethyltransferase, partial [Pseudonocardiaceae bacterium]
RAVAKEMLEGGLNVLTGGTDTHLVLADLRESPLNGQQAEDRLAEVGITVNRNAVPFDPRPPAVASGLRIGASPLATRGLQENDFHEIGKIITEALTGDLDDAKRASLTERTRVLTKRYPLYPQLAPRPEASSPDRR